MNRPANTYSVRAVVDTTDGQRVMADLPVLGTYRLVCGCIRYRCTRPGPETEPSGQAPTVELLSGCHRHAPELGGLASSSIGIELYDDQGRLRAYAAEPVRPGGRWQLHRSDGTTISVADRDTAIAVLRRMAGLDAEPAPLVAETGGSDA